ncbi:lipopolysaccharide biosynthesis protein [Globicatella sulfidifaciens]|uniref:Lipopolysaccharide biosynthesis protein n=1 Tax=Globicatella sulfidifaciens TaxID=136093 RepID=A0A7X8C4T9_9LACT|nr:lipopolysaccharide biosynthesis protein [Globicatella sulfidifaciens]NLJ18847.1 lipopolysaccharide biosynthesis protein [Globicatella sulfidifaciens]
MENESLKKKAIRGVSWSFVDNIASQGITFLVGIILARLLTPAEFGILGMITIFIAISNSIIDSGFSNALIRKNDAKRIDYNTVFIFNLVLSLVLYGVLYVASPAISRFFHEPQLVAITRVMGLLLLINALGIIQRTLLVKRVDFKTQTKVSVIASLGSAVVGVGMAWAGFGVWSLVGQQLSRQFLNTLFLWVFNRWRPLLEFSIQSFKELFSFGSKLLASGLIDTLFKNIYYIIIGRFYSAAQLGQYTRAEQFNMIFSSNLTSVIQRVSYPVLSSIQNEAERLREAYRRVIKSTMLVTFACMLGLAACAKPVILILIGEKWLVAAEYLQIICFSGMLYPLHAINLNILQVKGRSDLFLKLEIIKKGLAVLPITLGIIYGIKVMLLAKVFNSFLAYYLNARYSKSMVNYSVKEQIADILPTFLVSLGVAGVMWGITWLDLNVYLQLIVQVSVGLTLAGVIYEKLNLEEYKELKGIALSILKR